MMKAGCYIGTSGWSYDHWVGPFYAAALEKREWLTFYADRFRSVEINATFYRLPFATVVSGWRDRAPAGFRFAVKGSRRITHLNRLADPDGFLPTFFERIAGLGEHLGPILWQLPPRLSCDLPRLEAFLRLLPGQYRHAVEFRHTSWLVPEVAALLRDQRVARVSVSSRLMPADFTVTTDFAYLRFHGLRQGFAHNYSRAELRPWIDHARGCLAEGVALYAYFNNDAQARAVKNAAEFRTLVAA